MDLSANIDNERILYTVALLAHGYSVAEIATETHVAVGTVRNRIAAAKNIVGCNRETQLACWYFYKRLHLSLDFAPQTRRIGSFLSILLFAVSTVFCDGERAMRPVRRARRIEYAADDFYGDEE